MLLKHPHEKHGRSMYVDTPINHHYKVFLGHPNHKAHLMRYLYIVKKGNSLKLLIANIHVFDERTRYMYRLTATVLLCYREIKNHFTKKFKLDDLSFREDFLDTLPTHDKYVLWSLRSVRFSLLFRVIMLLSIYYFFTSLLTFIKHE